MGVNLIKVQYSYRGNTMVNNLRITNIYLKTEGQEYKTGPARR
jgi:hypothetical protein